MKALMVAVTCLTLAACSQGPGGGYKQPVGTAAGAALGGLAGAQFGGGAGALAATAVGALAGAVVGNDIGGSLDRADAAYYGRTPPTYYAAAPAPSYYSTSPGYAVPAYGGGGTVSPIYTPTQAPIRRSSSSGCRPVGNGIWCE